MKTDGTNGSTYYESTVRNQVKREKRSQFGEIMSQKNFSEFWNSNNTASISRWLEILGMLPKTVRLAFLTVIPPDEMSVPDLLQLNSNTIAMLKNEFSWLLTDKQVSDIILSLLYKKDYRQAAQVIESLNIRINDGNPDLFLSLWNDQRFGFGNKRCDKDVQSFLRQGLRLLPSPDNWNNTLINRLSPIAARVFRNSVGSWSMANTPAIYWGCANLSDYMSLSAKEILPLINKLTSVVANNLNGAQLGVIYTKRLTYAATKLDGTYKTSIADLVHQSLLVPNLRPEHLNSIPLVDTADLMKAVSSTAQGPPVQMRQSRELF
ncbi:hypothetical protein DAPPUDRAFT_244567 [Daphnia pulex]|uniref:Uncharacterized protein n=1 Tax=Daphnia pulex TaxID=6669 RepID=E9GL86_DAPPU|nr:hypothetical protein DAPPUDRAFT_244567 [Daphnia pulex]|eukprot:EFX79811.1 hypothetical protein DAPPUDRAFT_244567 [Daphnia pulex]